MAAAADHQDRFPPDAGEEEEEVILLTEVVEDLPTEVVLHLAGETVPDSLYLKEPGRGEPESPPPASVGGDDLEEFLASLKDLSADSGAPASAASASLADPSVLQEGFEEAARRQLASFLESPRLMEIVQEAVRETVEKMSQELLPRIAAQVLEQKIGAILKRLAQEE